MFDQPTLEFEGEHDTLWHLQAEIPWFIGGYGDNFAYDGRNVVEYEGWAEVILDALINDGTTVVTFNGTIQTEFDRILAGEIKMVYTTTPDSVVPFKEGGVADFVWMHGDTQQGPATMPKLRAFLAAWGIV